MTGWSLITFLKPNGSDICVGRVGRLYTVIYVDYVLLQSPSVEKGSAHDCGRYTYPASGHHAQPPSIALEPQHTQSPSLVTIESPLLSPFPLYSVLKKVNCFYRSQHQRQSQHSTKFATRGSSRYNVGQSKAHVSQY